MSDCDKNVGNIIRVATLLHDIGKNFVRRGEEGKHEEIGSEILSKVSNVGLDTIKKLVDFHHHERDCKNINELREEEKEMLLIVECGDRWDSMQRSEAEEGTMRGSPAERPLSSFFSDEKKFPVVRYYASYKNCKPSAKPTLDYKRCTTGFEDGLKKIFSNSKISDAARISGLLELLKEYTFFVPSYTQTDCHISLYHHSKMACAIAHALYLWKVEKNVKITKTDQLKNEEIFLLVCGDFVGIQRFIYMIRRGAEEKEAGKRFSKRLRGRSFLVQMAQYLVVNYLLERLGLGQESVVYSSGGNFAILAPNTEEVKQILEKCEKEISMWMRETMDPLGLVLATVQFKPADIPVKEGTWKIWEKIGNALAEKKLKRDREWLGELFSKEGKVSQKCRYCLGPAEKEDGCTLCTTSEKIGELWTEKDLVLVYGGKRQEGIGLEFNSKAVYLMKAQEKPQKGDVCKLLAGPEEGEEVRSLKWVLEMIKDDIVCSRDYRVVWEGKSFTELASPDKREEEKEKVFLGYLLMDVDGLGDLLKTKIRVPSDLAAFSEQLDLFFTRGVDSVIDDLGRENVYVVYSGGDDIFAVCRWDNTIQLAEKLQKEFNEFFGSNLTISGGIALARPRYPLYGAATMVDAEEKIAKGRKENGKVVKNGIGIFEYALSWKSFRDAIEFGKELASCNEISSSLLYNLLFIFMDKELVPPTRNARIAYTIARHLTNKKESNELLIKLKNQLTKKQNNSEYHEMIVTLSYALLKRRSERKEGE